jgi:hypothetical protein
MDCQGIFLKEALSQVLLKWIRNLFIYKRSFIGDAAGGDWGKFG